LCRWNRGNIGTTCGCWTSQFATDVVPPFLVPMTRKSGSGRRDDVAVPTSRAALLPTSATGPGSLRRTRLLILDRLIPPIG
jgi:hypothetical protein